MPAHMPTVGIPCNPVLFDKGVSLPPIEEGNPHDVQNLWATIEKNQEWVATFVLGLNTNTPYKEPSHTPDIEQQIRDADERRISGDRYTDLRNLGSFAVFFGAENTETVLDEFRNKSVVDIGSGAGVFSDELRRRANAVVAELDFSPTALQRLAPVFNGLGTRVVGDGTQMEFGDGIFDRSVSVFSTSVHANTISSRLSGLSEALRVTAEGGKAFVAPLFGGMVLRQQRWFKMQLQKDNPQFFDAEMQAYEKTLQQDAAMDFAVTGLVRALILSGKIKFTPILTVEKKGVKTTDCIAGIFEVQETLAKPEARVLIDQAVAQFAQ